MVQIVKRLKQGRGLQRIGETGRRMRVPRLQRSAPSEHRARHKGCIQRICRLPAPTLPDGGCHTTETDGIPHDKDELK